ncbi:MAG: AsmA family protein [Vibrio sp.]
MKKLLLIISVPIVAILIAVLGLFFFVNPNQFKPLIVEQAKAQTGFDLVIEGDIAWSFFPHLGFTIGQTQVLNPHGFKQDQVAKFDEAGLEVSVIPLLEKQLDIGNVTLNGADIFVQKLKDGRSNLDIVKQSAEVKAVETQAKENEPVTTETAVNAATDEITTGSQWKVNLEGITINNAKLTLLDETTNTNLVLSDANFTLAQFSFDEWSKADFNVTGKRDQQSFSAAGKTELKVSQDLSDYELRGLELEARYKDPSVDLKKLSLTLDAFQFDQANNMKLDLQGSASGMNFDINQAAAVTINKAIDKVQLTDMTVTGNLDGKDLPLSPLKLDLYSNLSYDLAKQHLDISLKKLTANDLAFDGSAQVGLAQDIPKIVFDLHSPEINLDALLKQLEKGSTASASSSKSTAKTSDAKATETKATETKASDSKATASKTASSKTAKAAPSSGEPDLSATRTLDVTGEISIDKFTASNAKLQNVESSFKVNRGVIDLQKFAANLYQGSVLANGKIDARKDVATYTIHKEVKGVQILPLLKDVADMDKLSGTGNIVADINGRSLNVDKAKQNIAGTVKLNFADGAIHGFNIANEIRKGKALFSGKKYTESGDQKTDFSALTATMKLANGVMNTNDLRLQSPLLRVNGSGDVAYVKETLNLLFKTSIVGTLKGQGGEDLKDLKNITIPVRIKGSWNDPKVTPDLSAVDEATKKKVKDKAQKEIDRGIDKLLGGKGTDKNDDVKKAVGGLLDGLLK